MAIAADPSEFACFNQALPQPSLPTQDQIKLPKTPLERLDSAFTQQILSNSNQFHAHPQSTL